MCLRVHGIQHVASRGKERAQWEQELQEGKCATDRHRNVLATPVDHGSRSGDWWARQERWEWRERI